MILQCPGCRKRLSLDDRNDGKMVKCPACGQQFRAGAPATRVPQSAAAPVKPRSAPTAPPPSQNDPGFDVVDDDYEVVDESPAAEPPPPPKPAKKASAETVRNAISPTRTQKVTLNQSRDEEPPVEDEADDEDPKPRKKKKKKKRSREPEAAGAWIPYAVGFGVLVLLVGGVALAGVLAGHGTLVLFLGVWLAIAIPVSTVILIISMILSSYIGGGIEFGEVHIVIPKAMGLLLVVNLVYLIPLLGWFLAIPVFAFGLMFLFHLDFWECRFLIFINWLLNTVFRWVIIGIVLAILGGALESGLRNASSGKGQDAEAAHLFADGTAELRGWLQKDEKRVIYARPREVSIKITNDLYDWGARKVWAGDPVENTRSGIPFTKKVIVDLPKDPAARKKIIDYHNQVAEQMNDDPIEDEGQRYVVIDYEPKERFGR
jgi:hypothetical protein